jgi:hypothetical protein
MYMMKIQLSLISLFIVFFTSCEKEEGKPAAYQIELEGKIEEIGPTFWMYGTHKITYNGKLFALKSSTINLDKYLNKKVTVWGDRVNGYPVDFGPEYIEVKRLIK